MPPMQRLTPAEKDTIAAMEMAGRTCGQIALRLGRSESTIYFALMTMGLRPRRRNCRPRRVVIRGGRPVRLFDAAEDAFIERLRRRGFTCRDIADAVDRRFGRPRSAATIRIRLLMLAVHAEAAP